MRICKKCGEVNDNETLVCINCGGGEFTETDDTVCPKCGARVQVDTAFCTSCGARISSDEVEAALDGEQVAAALTRRTDDDWKKDAVSVQQALNELYDNKNETIIDTREKVRCPNCGAELAVATAFCDKCGTPVSSVVEHTVVKRKICPHCGTPNTLTTPYCAYCFSSLADAETEDFQLAFDEQYLEDGVVKRAIYQSNDSKKLLVCSNCGTLNDVDRDFCVKCGLKLAVEEQKHYCPVCGAENASDAAFCSICRFSFEGGTPAAAEGRWKCDCGHVNEKDNAYCTICGKPAPKPDGGKRKKK